MEAVAGADLDHRIAREVLGKGMEGPVPPFSAEEHTASALAFEVSRQTGWKLHTSQTRGIWSAAWVEDPFDQSSTIPGGRSARS